MAKKKDESGLSPSSNGASGKSQLNSLKENPYSKFEVATNIDTWFGSVTEPVLKLALHMCEGYIWEARNGDRFVAHHAEIHQVEQCRDRLAWLLKQYNGEHFWPEAEEWEQLALIDFVRLLPRMWD